MPFRTNSMSDGLGTSYHVSYWRIFCTTLGWPDAIGLWLNSYTPWGFFGCISPTHLFRCSVLSHTGRVDRFRHLIPSHYQLQATPCSSCLCYLLAIACRNAVILPISTLRVYSGRQRLDDNSYRTYLMLPVQHCAAQLLDARCINGHGALNMAHRPAKNTRGRHLQNICFEGFFFDLHQKN